MRVVVIVVAALEAGRSRELGFLDDVIERQEWAAQPAFSYRHEWQPGDLVIWDNCGCMHRVVPYDENSGRKMQRTTIMGEERVA